MEKPVSPQNFQALSREVDNLHSSLRFIRNITASINYNLYLDSESFAPSFGSPIEGWWSVVLCPYP